MAVYREGSWGEATLIDPDGQLFSVSCASSSFCVALDGSGKAFVFDGSSWSGPTATGTDLTQVSCVSASFCVAVGGSGQGATYDGSRWSELSSIGIADASSVSCASESFCMAVGSGGGGPGYAVTYDGHAWGVPTEMDSETESSLTSVSCGSPSFCVAVGNFGDEETYSAGVWSKPTQIGKEGTIGTVSCHSEFFCVALSDGGEAIRYNGSTWSSTGRVPEGVARALACPGESFCVAVGGYASTYDGSTWTGAVPVGGGGLTSVSCTASTFCTAVDWHGRALTYSGSGWSAPSSIDGEGGLDAVSCASASFCVAAGGRKHGVALTDSAGAWSAPQEVDPGGAVNALSCPSTSFCVALTEHHAEEHELGYALAYHDGVWGSPSEIDAEGAPQSLSCTSESFCVAVGWHDALVYNNGSWSSPQAIFTEGNLWGVSCASTTFCLAVAEHFGGIGPPTYGDALIYNGTGWSAPTEIPRAPERGPFDVGSVSCASTSFCMAVAKFEAAGAIFENGVWGAWNTLEINGSTSSVSCPSAAFCTLVNYAGEAFTYSNPSPPVQQPGGGGPGGGAPASGRPRLLGKHVDPHTGEITLEYDFPEAGTGEADGEVDESALGEGRSAARGASHRQSKRCAPSKRRQRQHGCRGDRVVRYGRTALTIPAAAVHKVNIKPSAPVLAALKRGKTLHVRVALVFTPAGTREAIREVSAVRVRLPRGRHGRRGRR